MFQENIHTARIKQSMIDNKKPISLLTSVTTEVHKSPVSRKSENKRLYFLSYSNIYLVQNPRSVYLFMFIFPYRNTNRYYIGLEHLYSASDRYL